MKYIIYGRVVESDWEFLSVNPVLDNSVQTDVQVVKGNMENIKKEVQLEIEKNGNTNEKGEPLWLWQRIENPISEIAVLGDGYFRISAGKKIEYEKDKEADSLLFEQWILCLCLSVTMMQAGKVMLHGSGLYYKGNMIVISGESGSGKSTLTNELLKYNYQFMADDIVSIDNEDEKTYGNSAFPLRRVCADVIKRDNIDKEKILYMPDNGADKYGIDMKDNYFDKKVEVGALFYIQKSDDVKNVVIEHIVGLESVKYIIQSLYNERCYKKLKIISNMMKDFLTIANNVPIYIIKRPIEKDSIIEESCKVRELIESVTLYR